MLFPLVWQYLRTRWVEVSFVFFLQIAATLASLELPGLNARIIDEGVAVANTTAIWKLGAFMFLLTAAQGIATGIAVFLGARLSMSLGAWLREKLYAHVQTFAAQDIHVFGAPSLITRATNDVQQIQTVVMMSFVIMVQAPLMGIGALIQAFRQDLHLWLILLIMVPILSIVVGFIMTKLAPQFERQQNRIDTMNTVIREELSGIRVIRAFVREPFISSRYLEANNNLREIAIRIGLLFAVLFPSAVFIISLTNVAIVWFGGHLIASGHTQIGSLFAFLSYVGMLLGSVMMSAFIIMSIPRARISARRIREVIERNSSVVSASQPRDIAPVENLSDKATGVPSLLLSGPSAGRKPWTFTLDHVSVQYLGAENPVLRDITLTFAPGTTTAIIGATGSGKTTLIQLLPRLIDPTRGQVKVNGVPTTDIELTLLRQHISVVPQRAYLFSGTIASTVSGVTQPDNAQRERVLWALRGACADEFVSRMDEGIDAIVEPGGKNFSGGQRQRLSIARALYRQSDLYIFDDSSSALDASTDTQLRASLPQYTHGAAIVHVAQRVASVKDADTIVVLDAGRIVGQGRHEDLLRTCVTYQEIVASQSGQEDK
ncbi:ABC transporter ATP-binding protein [Schaalia sp. lx-260]|uniref:ABC transporter ATP-binding protein n=1 Tax=Schaalia sp. lx-260 TaxID=2899082 RepID=UPI001E31507D|nr:ABC transporter ATP-binding protein/permease [Schaalia sp. lx-260]